MASQPLHGQVGHSTQWRAAKHRSRQRSCQFVSGLSLPSQQPGEYELTRFLGNLIAGHPTARFVPASDSQDGRKKVWGCDGCVEFPKPAEIPKSIQRVPNEFKVAPLP